MILAALIAIVGGMCLREHWPQCAREEQVWRRRLRAWAAQGLLFPILAWMMVCFGWGSGFPSLIPGIAEAQAAGGPWVRAWIAASLAGALLATGWWLAVSYFWLLTLIGAQAQNRAEFAFNVAVLGVFSGGAAALLVWTLGWVHLGSALVVFLLPLVHFTLDLINLGNPKPVYDRALGQLKFGKYEQAEWELISQLEKSENDFEGWMMLAELYACQHRNIADAARVILDICQDPKTGPARTAVACHKLADWQLEIEGNPAGAKAALELLCRKLPGTHIARMALQRIAQLPSTAEEWQRERNPKKVSLPVLREDFAGAEIAPHTAGQDTQAGPARPAREEAVAEAEQLAQKLSGNPDDHPARERFALVLGVQLGKIDLAIEQLDLLRNVPGMTDEQRARWLAQIAAWEWNRHRDAGQFRTRLKEIIAEYPATAHAFAAQRQLFLLGADRAGQG